MSNGVLLQLTSLSGHKVCVMSTAMGGLVGAITRSGVHATILYVDGDRIWVKESIEKIFEQIDILFGRESE